MDHHDTNPPAISVRGLGKTWPGGVEAVKGIDFDVTTGEVFGLLGPNGAGKSTTVAMLTTTVRPTSGSARLYGRDVATEAITAHAESAVVFQDPVVDRALTGRRNFAIHTRLWGVNTDDASRRIEELADSFDLVDLLDRPVATYSGGQRRRLEIARALVSEPRVLFLDEPPSDSIRVSGPSSSTSSPVSALASAPPCCSPALPGRGRAPLRWRRRRARRTDRRARSTGHPPRRAR